MNNDFKDRLSHIIDACEEVNQCVKDTSYEQFISETDKKYAVSFLFIVIGEAISNIREELEENLPEFPWNDIVGMRNRIAHGYFSVDYTIVWNTIFKDIPVLYEEMKKLHNNL